MTKLVWNDIGERFYEAGVDRGVLYPEMGDGVPWNGLISVNETPSGGDPKPYYIDGTKYIIQANPDEYGATINAFTYPDEFAECDGTAFIDGGLAVNEQQRKSFGLSYRTAIGNDLDGTDHGYKLHLIYNAMAMPTSKSYSTFSDTPAALTFSWNLTTVPEAITGLLPSSHLVMDSTKTNKDLLHLIENQLYGSSDNAPNLITPSQLLQWLVTFKDAVKIIPDLANGLAKLVSSDEADLIGSKTLGLYYRTENSRLVETATPGLYKLEN